MGARGWKSWLGPPEAPPGHAGNTALLHWLSLIVGALGYLLFAGVYTLAGVNPATDRVAGALPAVAAFVFGVS
ncbi:MAG TPA: hypothetical protein PLU22_05255, partial [Polyangiaceae bacterium]|nr:hypothetical protein [Polyangiaceae bacterium]